MKGGNKIKDNTDLKYIFMSLIEQGLRCSNQPKCLYIDGGCSNVLIVCLHTVYLTFLAL